jgi:hypothetical protein
LLDCHLAIFSKFIFYGFSEAILKNYFRVLNGILCLSVLYFANLHARVTPNRSVPAETGHTLRTPAQEQAAASHSLPSTPATGVSPPISAEPLTPAPIETKIARSPAEPSEETLGASYLSSEGKTRKPPKESVLLDPFSASLNPPAAHLADRSPVTLSLPGMMPTDSEATVREGRRDRQKSIMEISLQHAITNKRFELGQKIPRFSILDFARHFGGTEGFIYFNIEAGKNSADLIQRIRHIQQHPEHPQHELYKKINHTVFIDDHDMQVVHMGRIPRTDAVEWLTCAYYYSSIDRYLTKEANPLQRQLRLQAFEEFIQYFKVIAGKEKISPPAEDTPIYGAAK